MRAAALLLALWGWASLALAVAQVPPVVGVAVAGFVAAACARRAPRLTAAVELFALAAVTVCAPADRLGFVLLGGALVAAARAVGEVLRRRHADGSSSTW